MRKPETDEEFRARFIRELDELSAEPRCEICDNWPDDCICPACPRCGSRGDSDCYQEGGLGICGELYGKLTLEQQIAQAERHVSELYRDWEEACLALDWMKSTRVDKKG